MAANVIDFERVSFAYQHENVLEAVDLKIAAGDFVAVIGPNGGGKTTLIKLIAGLLEPAQGAVRVFGQSPRKVMNRIGYVPQNADINLHFPILARDVVLMGRLRPGPKWPRPSRADRRIVLDVMAQMGVAELAGRRIGDLSGGQRQRVFIARALATQPEIILLDEPTSGIDAQGQVDLYCLLEQLNADITIIMASHDMMVLSSHVKSVVCVNRSLHYHDRPELTHDMMAEMYPHGTGAACPVELVAHGIPHRVLRKHE